MRCVRRAFLFGDDKYTGVNYDHRREWIREKILSQTDVFALDDYLSLVEMTGRAIIDVHKGYIPQQLPDILRRLGLNNDTWLDQIKYFDKWYYKAIGTVDNLKKYCGTLKQKYIKGLPKVIKA